MSSRRDGQSCQARLRPFYQKSIPGAPGVGRGLTRRALCPRASPRRPRLIPRCLRAVLRPNRRDESFRLRALLARK